jgi:nucleoside-diphosphate-sugar epimerase
MRIFVTGATGAIGRCLLPRLMEAGHDVVGLTRSADRARALREHGAQAVVGDMLDREVLTRAVVAARPDVVIHQATDLKSFTDPRKFAEQFEGTNRLRTAGTDILLAAAREAGARRFVAQSYTGLPYARVGGPIKREEDPLDSDPAPAYAPALAAIKHLEAAVTAFGGGVALRYGAFYGPGTTVAPDGATVRDVRRRRFPVAGKGDALWSFIHVDDAAAATVAAIESDRTGIFNVTDDEPVAVREWLPALAEMIGAPPPRRVPLWVARLAVGPHVAVMMSGMRGVSNAKARRELGWRPARATWREGFREVLRPG